MVENVAFQAPDNEAMKRVWWVLVKKYPGLAGFDDIKALLMNTHQVPLEDGELSRVLRELQRLRLADFYENRDKAGARIDAVLSSSSEANAEY